MNTPMMASATHMAMDRMFAQHNVAIKIRMELGSGEAIKQGVMGGLGLSVPPLNNLPLELAASCAMSRAT